MLISTIHFSDSKPSRTVPLPPPCGRRLVLEARLLTGPVLVHLRYLLLLLTLIQRRTVEIEEDRAIPLVEFTVKKLTTNTA